MASPPWQLQGHAARLNWRSLTGRIDLARPDEGLRLERCQDRELGPLQLLGVVLPGAARAAEPPSAESPADAYVRGADLIATYDPADERPFRTQVYWRSVESFAASSGIRAVELHVSVQTDLLDSRPEVRVVSQLPPAEVQRLADPEDGAFEGLPLDAARGAELDASGAPGCLLFRFARLPFSYAEMIHPADFRRLELKSPSAQPRALRLEHLLFPGHLEKGVILRGRLRAALLAREDDAQQALACYREFVAEEPPLTV